MVSVLTQRTVSPGLMTTLAGLKLGSTTFTVTVTAEISALGNGLALAAGTATNMVVADSAAIAILPKVRMRQFLCAEQPSSIGQMHEEFPASAPPAVLDR